MMLKRLVATTLTLHLALMIATAQESFAAWLDDTTFVVHNGSNHVQVYQQLALPSVQRSSGAAPKPPRQKNLQRQDGSSIIQIDDNLVLIRDDGRQLPLTQHPSPERNARLSPNESMLAYTRDNDLYVYDLHAQQEMRLTHDGSASVYNGWASWVYYEEILGRASQYTAFWWSPDSRRVAFLRFDDSPVPVFSLVRSSGTHGSVEQEHFPKPGDPNPMVSFGIADLSTGDIIWIPQVAGKDQYSAWPFWTPDGQHLIIQELNRGQDTLDFVQVDQATGHRQHLYRETQATWVTFYEEMRFLSPTTFVVKSDRNGWENLYLHHIDGTDPKSITQVDWAVQSIVGIDSARQTIYFYGTGGVNTDRHLYRVQSDGSNLTQLTHDPGWHQIELSPGYSYFHDTFSSLTDPGISRIMSATGEKIYTLQQHSTDANAEAGIAVQWLEVQTPEGYSLPCYWVLPKAFRADRKYPVVFMVYGGPNAATVSNRYRDYSSDFYANNDIIRVEVDHRGSGKFGKKGLDYMHRSLGQWEIEDLITTVKALHNKPFVDRARIGITGGSYGGYVTCLALTRGTDYFTHGVSLFPVTDWQLYDNIYTERYMDTPQANPGGYRGANVMTYASKLKGNLLIVHGEMDDNVHMQHTLQLAGKLQELGKHFEMMIYPGVRHGWGGAKRNHLTQLTQHFWLRHFSKDHTAGP